VAPGQISSTPALAARARREAGHVDGKFPPTSYRIGARCALDQGFPRARQQWPAAKQRVFKGKGCRADEPSRLHRHDGGWLAELSKVGIPRVEHRCDAGEALQDGRL
jgi:hypothetical protein